MKNYTLITESSSRMGACCAKAFSLIMASENLEMLKIVLDDCEHKENYFLSHCDFMNHRAEIYDTV